MKFEDRIQLRLSDLTEEFIKILLLMDFMHHPEWVVQGA